MRSRSLEEAIARYKSLSDEEKTRLVKVAVKHLVGRKKAAEESKERNL